MTNFTLDNKQLTHYTNKASDILGNSDGLTIFGRMYELQKDVCDPMNIDTLNIDILNPSVLLMYKSSIYAKLQNELKEFCNEVDKHLNPKILISNESDFLEEAVDCISYALLLVAINSNHCNTFNTASYVDAYINKSFIVRYYSISDTVKHIQNHVYSSFEYANLNWHRNDKKTNIFYENEELLDLVVDVLNAMLLVSDTKTVLNVCIEKAAKVLKYMASKANTTLVDCK